MLIAVRHLLGGEHDVDEVPAQRAGQGLFQQGQVFLRLLLGHPVQGLVQVGDDLLLTVHIAAVDVADGVFAQLEAAFQLADLFLIHDNLAVSNVFCAGSAQSKHPFHYRGKRQNLQALQRRIPVQRGARWRVATRRFPVSAAEAIKKQGSANNPRRLRRSLLFLYSQNIRFFSTAVTISCGSSIEIQRSGATYQILIPAYRPFKSSTSSAYFSRLSRISPSYPLNRIA